MPADFILSDKARSTGLSSLPMECHRLPSLICSSYVPLQWYYSDYLMPIYFIYHLNQFSLSVLWLGDAEVSMFFHRVSVHQHSCCPIFSQHFYLFVEQVQRSCIDGTNNIPIELADSFCLDNFQVHLHNAPTSYSSWPRLRWSWIATSYSLMYLAYYSACPLLIRWWNGYVLKLPRPRWLLCRNPQKWSPMKMRINSRRNHVSARCLSSSLPQTCFIDWFRFRFRRNEPHHCVTQLRE